MTPRAKHRFSGLAVAFAALTLPLGSVRADVPPEPGYVESCTAAVQSRGGRDCRDCGTYFGNPADFCAQQVGAGYAMVCRSRGASNWTEVWCRDAPAGTPSATAPASPAAGPSISPASAPVAAPASHSERDADDCSTTSGSTSALVPVLVALAACVVRRRLRATV